MLIPQSVDPDLYDAVLSLELALGTTVPLGKDAEIFNLGPVMDISIKYQRRIKRQIGFCLQGTFGYDFMPIEAESSISLVHAGAGTGVSWQLFPRIIADASIQGGYFYSFLNDSSRIEIDNDAEVVGGNPFAAGGLGFTFLVSPAFGLGMDIYYKNYLGFLSGITMGLSASYRFIRRGDEFVRQEDIQRLQEQIREEQVPEFTGPELEFESVELAPIFPVFHKYYDDHPVGRLMLVNESTEPVEDIRLDFFVKSYMDDPKQLILPESIPPEGRQEIDLYGLFTEKILEVSEGTKVTANISVDYRLQGYQRRKELVETLRVHNRNAITWDDDRRAAAFVTAKDNAIQKFAKNTSATIISSTSRSSLKQLHTALAIYQTLSVYGLRYEIDPTTPYKDFSRDRYTLDYLQFPVQTLEYKAGDCDDLSILYNALLEAVGIETAFITIPGHIFTAFCLDINQNDAWKTFHYPDDLIFERNKIWLPVELTVLDEGFVKAWELAARQWREHTGTGRAGFFPIRDAWQVYEPVGYPIQTTELEFPAARSLESAYRQEVGNFIEREIGNRVAGLQAEIEKGGETPKIQNKLGVLYARYGLHKDAERHFQAALEQSEYLPALMNVGNLLYMREEFDRALAFFERAARQDPGKPQVLLAMARTNHELENYGTARDLFSRLKEADPNLASRFSYLELRGEEAVRAADLNRLRSTVLWEEDE